jgi:hypothetical protein
MPRLHPVPMCRQRISEAEWQDDAGDELGDRIEWSDRVCGMACVRMILLAYGKPAPTVTQLLKLGVDQGALTDRGWLHAGLAEITTQLGVPGRAEPVPAGELIERLTAAPLIISVGEKFPVDGRRGAHVVIARGYTTAAGRPASVLICDPSAWGQDHDRVPLQRLTASYTGRAVTFPILTP